MKCGSVLNKATEVNLFPYPHIVIQDCLPKTLYDELSETFPEKMILPETYDEGVRIDLHARDGLKCLTGKWLEFVQYHTSREFWHRVFALFGDVINILYPELVITKPLNWTAGPRGGDTLLQMECQPGVNTPQSTEKRVRGPHLDNPIELYAGLLYMGEGEGGDLEIDAYVKQPKFYGKLEIKDECVETVAVVPYEPNMFVFFINTISSIHAVTPRPATDKCRRLCNITGELPYQLFKTGHGRY